MITVGLTGGFQTGKTAVLSMFEKCGARVLSADRLVHLQLQENKALQRGIKKLFGAGIFKKGKIDRRLLAGLVFPDKKSLEALNQITHPYVKKEIFSFFRRCYKKSSESIIVVEVPLLFETGFEKFFDVTVVVSTRPEVVRTRIVKECGWTLEDVKIRMRRQFPLARKIKRCDFVIDNNAGLEPTFCQVRKFMDFLKPLKGLGMARIKGHN